MAAPGAAFWAGGLTYYGGLIGAVGYAVYFLRRERFPFWKAADMSGFAIALGLAWGRMGCFLAGCCFGKVSDVAWATSFPRMSPASEAHFRAGILRSEGLPSLPVHPTQLYESLVGAAMIAEFVDRVVFGAHPGIDAVGSDPDRANERSWRALAAAGFRPVADRPEGARTYRVMRRDRPTGVAT